MNNEQIQIQQAQPTQEVIVIVNSFETLLDRTIEIFCNKRLDNNNSMEFKSNLKAIKELYGIRLSKEYLKPYFTKDKGTFRTRFKRILEKADLKTTQETRFTEKLSSKNGNLYIHKDREILTFFDI